MSLLRDFPHFSKLVSIFVHLINMIVLLSSEFSICSVYSMASLNLRIFSEIVVAANEK